MKRRAVLLALLSFWLFEGTGSAQQGILRDVFAAPIGIERGSSPTSVPIELRAGKLFVDAAANGQPREFIFDTGSPSILTRSLADSLGLETVGQNTGVDANGNKVTMDVAVLDSLSIGDVEFRGVPVLVFDFSDLGLGSCLMDGGVLGSEILPGSAWRIDLENKRLGIAETAKALGDSAADLRTRLYDFGYPHAPIVDYSLGDVSDKALFDTGSAEQVALFAEVMGSPAVRERIVRGSTRRGRGSEGESAGGQGDFGELVKFGLTGLRLGAQPLGDVRATTRAAPPTLVGAGVLASHTVTLDYPGEQFLMQKRSVTAQAREERGYSIAFTGDHARVVQLFDDSPAAAAGLKLGDRVTEVQGRSLVIGPTNDRCTAARWLIETFDATAAADISVLRDGRAQTIRVPATPSR